MNKKYMKIGITIITVMLIIFINITIVNAGGFNPGDYEEATKPKVDGGIAKFGGQIIYIVQYVGYTIAVLTLLSIGIKYMLSAPNEKADLKARMIPYVIGAVILFGGVSLVSLIYNVVN